MRKLTLMVITVCGAGALAATGAATATATAAASTKTEHFTLVTTSTTASQPVFSVIATGAFIDGGTTTHEPKGGLTLHLTSGTITLERNKPHPQVTKTQTTTVCMQTAFSSFSYRIVQGTGAYQGISGSGHATEHDAVIERLVHGSCSPNFAAAQGVITATGTVSLP